MKREHGMTLLEVLVALGILGLVAGGFLAALTISSRANIVSQEHTTAESLARTQMEYLKGCAYIDYSEPGHPEYAEVAAPESYAINIAVAPIEPDPEDPGFLEPLDEGEDKEVQKITIEVYHQGRLILDIETFKAQLEEQ